MNESPLQKLLRLRKEKEQANASTTQVEPESSTLEAVQGPSNNPEVSSGTEGSGVGSSEGGVALPEETTSEDSNVLMDVGNSVDVSASVEPAEVIPEPQAKPMSAMERLRALKSGGVKKDDLPVNNLGSSNTVTASNNTGNVSVGSIQEVKTPIETVLQDLPPPKPRKTHPIAMEMAELEAALDAHVPGFVSILSTIHKKLKVDPDIVTLLDDEEIAKIVAGLEKHTNVTIVAPSAVKAAKSKAKKEPVSAMDL